MTKAKRIKYGMVGAFVFILMIITGFVLSGPSKKNIKAIKQLSLLSDNIRNHYRNRPGYWGLNTETAVSSKIAPENMISDGEFRSAAGIVKVGSGANGDIIMPGTKTFDITYKNVNFKDCVDLVTYKYTDEKFLGLVSINIINEKGENLFSWGMENSLPVIKSKANNTCYKKNDIIWSYE